MSEKKRTKVRTDEHEAREDFRSYLNEIIEAIRWQKDAHRLSTR